MELLAKSTTNVYVYESLAPFLSSTMTNTDPLSIVRDTLDSYSTPTSLKNEVAENPVMGVPMAVALQQIEMPIYNNAQKPLAQSGPPEVISIQPSNRGGYTVKLLVSGYPYRSEWSREYGTWRLDDFVEDDGEYNDYHDLATPHPLGRKVIYSLSSRRDYDWYVLEIPRAGRLTIRTEGNIDTALYVCTDPTNQQTMERTRIGEEDRDNTGYGLNEMVTGNVRAGQVYARVRLASGEPGEYILFAGMDGEIDNVPFTVPYAVPPAAVYEEIELPIGSPLLGFIPSMGEVHYVVRTTRAGILVVETHGSTDTVMYAYDSNRQEIADDDDSGLDYNARIEFIVSANETYYFRVRGWSDTSGPYSITANIHTEDSRNYIQLYASTTFTSATLRQGETHYYRIYLETDPYYDIIWRDSDNTGGMSNPADIIVGIRKEGATNYLLPVSDDGSFGLNNHRVYRPTESGNPKFDTNNWYIIEVRGYFNSSQGNYQIRFY
jgi:hypothetical protein